MKFAAIALIAVVAAHETAQPHSHTAPAEEEREHRHHHDGGDDKKHHKPHHPHHKPHHPHHKPHHEKKTEGALKADIIQLEQIVVGVLKGAVNAEGFNDIATCIADLEHVLGDATTAVKDFKAGGATNVINGLKVVGDLIATVKTGMADCSQTTADWQRLEAMAKVISSPRSFAYHVGKDLLINGQDIFDDIAAAVGDYESQKWEAFGEEVGKAAAKTILGQELDAALAGTGCRANSDQSSCDAAGCSWCTSFAVANACNSVDDAKKLPSAVFVCDNLSANDLFLF